MGARFRSWWRQIEKHPVAVRLSSWWQKIKQHRVAIGVVGIVLVVIIALIISGYRFDWTGFNGYTQVTTAYTTKGPSAGNVVRTEVSQPGKALWDWMQLLIIPVALAFGVWWLNRLQQKRDQQLADKRTQTERDMALDSQREAALQAYIDKISELLLKEHLGELTADGKLKPEYGQARKIARVRTITVLTQLDPRRIGYVFAFLREAGLLSVTSNDNAVSLSQADLRAVNWRQARLSAANLGGADLRESDLSGASLIFANLSWANLLLANLSEATLSEANLSQARLSGADLSGANLSGANLSDADLSFADLSGANLNYALLVRANLAGADGITIEKLEKQAKSLAGAAMPDGSTHP